MKSKVHQLCLQVVIFSFVLSLVLSIPMNMFSLGADEDSDAQKDVMLKRTLLSALLSDSEEDYKPVKGLWGKRETAGRVEDLISLALENEGRNS